ncbi:hypothetical protein EAE91_20515 [Photorhabdus noenieputensis]|uniref:hypothetical protein n=1 Tax=Photorhabdus noenieputensis TaxID=1208607 RepID=UPI001BD286AD|nr:hypothetical protein [Photorhabdus noenieputensis]MBS9439436.1 hypothetical protein [Photorhabdus noenieputensis]MCK3670643.1 hypothetical protein [Photorhabdus noenieputensis]
MFNFNMRFNVSTLTADIVSGITILENCPVVITVTYSGDDIHKVTETTDIMYDYGYFDGIPRISRDVEKNIFTAKFVFTVYSGDRDLTIIFSMDKATDPDAKLEIKLHSISKNDFSHAGFTPIIMGDSWVKDFSPAEDDEEPSVFSGNLLINIYALNKTNDPLPYFQIPLVTDRAVRIFGYDGEGITEEILPFISEKDNYQYYINTDSRGFVALRVFPKKSEGNYSVNMLTKLSYLLKSASSSILMITKDIEPTLPAPDIAELNGNKLMPSVGNSSTGFHVIIPFYEGVRPRDRVFLMIREGYDETQGESAVITDLNQLDIPFISVPYTSIPNTGSNELYYYVADANGNVAVSSARYFNLTRSILNVPPEIRRILAVPRIFSHKDQIEFRQSSKMNLASILGGGLDAHIAVGEKNGIEVNNVINVRIYINGIVNDNPFSKIYSVEPHTVTADALEAGEIIIPLGQAPFTNVNSYRDGAPGWVYITYSVGMECSESTKDSKIWFGHIDTVLPGQ